MTDTKISTVTRTALFDELRLTEFNWSGRFAESAFLGRIFDLIKLPSMDYRHSNMAEDVEQHRDHWQDWGGPDWVYDDHRLNLLRCDDGILLNFLCETLNPVVRSKEEEVEKFADIINKHLVRDGLEIYPASYISGRPLFAGREHNQVRMDAVADAHQVAVTLQSTHIMAQITRMQTMDRDPALAIGTAKEFVESMCKNILTAHGITTSGSENLPQLVRTTMKALNILQESDSKNAMDRALGALASLTHGLAELRGQLGSGHGHHPDVPVPPLILAKLAVGAATTLGVFLYEAHSQK